MHIIAEGTHVDDALASFKYFQPNGRIRYVRCMITDACGFDLGINWLGLFFLSGTITSVVP